MGRRRRGGARRPRPVAIPFSVPDGRAIRRGGRAGGRRDGGAPSIPPNPDLGWPRLIAREHAPPGRRSPRPRGLGRGGARPGRARRIPRWRRSCTTPSPRSGRPPWSGAVTDDPDGREYTNVLLFDGDRGPRGPLRQGAPGAVRRVRAVPPTSSRGSRPSSRCRWTARRGSGSTRSRSAGCRAFGTPICFENSFPDIPRQMVRDGAGFLVVTVNNASYGFTAASAQHEQMSRMRAIEARPLGRGRGGIGHQRVHRSHRARSTAQEGLFRTAILRGTIRSSDERTWYVRLGDWLPWLALALRARDGRPAAAAGAPCGPRPSPSRPGYRTLVILPTYQEVGHDRTRARRRPRRAADVDVLVVDDSSPDGTGDDRGGACSVRAADPARRAPAASPGSPAPTWRASTQGSRRGLRPRRGDGLRSLARPVGAPGSAAPTARGAST